MGGGLGWGSMPNTLRLESSLVGRLGMRFTGECSRPSGPRPVAGERRASGPVGLVGRSGLRPVGSVGSGIKRIHRGKGEEFPGRSCGHDVGDVPGRDRYRPARPYEVVDLLTMEESGQHAEFRLQFRHAARATPATTERTTATHPESSTQPAPRITAAAHHPVSTAGAAAATAAKPATACMLSFAVEVVASYPTASLTTRELPGGLDDGLTNRWRLSRSMDRCRTDERLRVPVTAIRPAATARNHASRTRVDRREPTFVSVVAPAESTATARPDAVRSAPAVTEQARTQTAARPWPVPAANATEQPVHLAARAPQQTAFGIMAKGNRRSHELLTCRKIDGRHRPGNRVGEAVAIRPDHADPSLAQPDGSSQCDCQRHHSPIFETHGLSLT